jgi:GMP synthase (glutamine-hydrolysing)
VRVLSIVHQADAGPGVFAPVAAARGCELVEWTPANGPPPAAAAGCHGVLVLGGAMHPDQDADHPWLADEKRRLGAFLETGVPMLGVCLGAELIAEVAGGATRRLPGPEIGWFDISLTAEGSADPVLGALPAGFAGFQWHSYACDPPPGFPALAIGDGGVDAFRFGEAWAIQFHAEVTGEIVGHWLDDWESDRDAVAAGFDPAPVRAETTERMGRSNELGARLFAAFLDYAAARPGQA